MERRVAELRQLRQGAYLVERRDADRQDAAAVLIGEAACHGLVHRQAADSTLADAHVKLALRRVELLRDASELERPELRLRADVLRKGQPAEAQDVPVQRAASLPQARWER